jgi:2-methylcitrate dehydratase PrpD
METRELASFVAHSRLQDIPETVQDEAVRAIVNWFGCALGGCLDPAVDTALDALLGCSGPAQATLIGRGKRTDLLSAALFNAIGSNILDFDDTHVATHIHPSVPVAAALFPLAERHAASGTEVTHAFILGVEVACRAGLTLGPAHYDSGWHVTSTCGVLGAAAACAKLLGLDAQQLAWALGIAATQSSGINEMTGSQSNSLSVGFAARNGLMAALLAQQGFTAAETALEGRRGFVQVLGSTGNSAALLSGLGATWELTRTAYKFYPCGIALHPVIDGCLQLRREHNLKPRNVARVGLSLHPLVMQIAGRREPQTALGGKLSVYHAAAVALVDGAVSVRQFQGDRVLNRRVMALRARVEAIADPSLAKEEARVEITLRDGSRFEHHVRHALGGLQRPMTDADLADKFRALATEVLATDQAERLLALAWNIRALGDVGALIRASVPEEDLEPQDLPGSPLIPR